MCDGAFLTEEYTYDAGLLKDYLIEKIQSYPNVEIIYSARIVDIQKHTDCFEIRLKEGHSLCSPFVLNATYASVNQINQYVGCEFFKIKYELCEIILTTVNDRLQDTGLTVMDGPFFSIMPFGKTGFHSLTAVAFTPHMDCKEPLPRFTCQKDSRDTCSPRQLGNCNECPAKPVSAWPYMSNLARKYMKDDLKLKYHHSLFSMKPILLASEIDDSRPTVIRVSSERPTFVSVLSGKINTVYDLDEILDQE
jgi:hypothetical protein